MADVFVTTVNKSGQTAKVRCDEESDFLANVKKQAKREDLESFKVEPADKPKETAAEKKARVEAEKAEAAEKAKAERDAKAKAEADDKK